MITKRLTADRVGVRCQKKHRSKHYVIDPPETDPIVVMGSGCPIVELQPGEVVVSQDGEIVKATGRFFRTAETIDPFHIVFDIF